MGAVNESCTRYEKCLFTINKSMHIQYNSHRLTVASAEVASNIIALTASRVDYYAVSNVNPSNVMNTVRYGRNTSCDVTCLNWTTDAALVVLVAQFEKQIILFFTASNGLLNDI